MTAEAKNPELEALERVPETDIPERLRAVFFPFNRADWLWSVAALSVLLTVDPIYGRPAALGVFLAWTLWMWNHPYGRSYELLGQRFQNGWIKWVKKGVILSPDPGTRRLDRLWEHPPPIPLGIQGIGEVGVLHNSRDGTDSIVVTGTGSGLASLPLPMQYQVLDRLAEGIRKLSALERGTVGLSFVFRRGPADLERIESIYEGILHPDVRKPMAEHASNGSRTPADIRNLRLKSISEETMGKIRQYSGDVTMAVVLTVSQQETLRKVRSSRKRGKGERLAPEALRRLVVNKLGRMAVEVLTSCNIEDPKVLNVREAHKFLHDVWEADVDRSNDYRRWLASSSTEEIGLSQLHSPTEIVVDKDHSTTDGTHHAIVRITGSPPKESDDFFPQLHAADVPWLTVTLLGRVVKSNREYAILDRLIPMRSEFRSGVLGVVHEGPKARKKAEDIARRQELIFESRVSQHYNILVVVSNTDLQELQDGVEEVLRTARTMGLDAEVVQGEYRQVPAHWSAATGVNML
jgi:hypothetical protein